MKIAVDLSPLQTPHRMRGIGATVIHFINNVSEIDKKKHEFVFYIFEDKDSPLGLLDLAGFNYEIKTGLSKKTEKPSRLPWKLGWPIRALKQATKLTDFYFGDDRLKRIGKIDAFLQFEQDKSLPRGRVKKVIVLYDLIQYIMKTDYLIDYNIARTRDRSRKSAFNHHMHRWIYLHKLKANVRRADSLLAISTQTKNDFIKYTGAKSKKITVVPLGVTSLENNSVDEVKHHKFIASSWGYLKRPYVLERPYLLFVGGADSRRKLSDLVTAFNHLRAEGQDLKLVLVGDILEGPENVPITVTRKALESSSYSDDIIYMGFVTDEQKADLYKNASAFVYPSVYEGFGLPVLEALEAGCPTICYDIPPVREVAGERPIYANGYLGIKNAVLDILSKKSDKVTRQKTVQTWTKTAQKIISEISK